jgi:hypothetical protein
MATTTTTTGEVDVPTMRANSLPIVTTRTFGTWDSVGMVTIAQLAPHGPRANVTLSGGPHWNKAGE